jgi:hypothetical protein
MTPLLLLLTLAPSQPPITVPIAVRPESCQKILAAITDTATGFRRLPGGQPPGDERTRLLVAAAAAAALKLPKEESAPAFCLALAIGLDDSEILRRNFLLGRTIRAIESDEQRKSRLAVLGKPSVQTRRDWCQHLAVSAGLVVLVGSDGSRAAGILKETLDAQPGGSGFSLADLAADEAGLRLAELVLQDPRRLETLADKGDLAGMLPTLKDLPDGWSVPEIEKKFGGLEDPRFRAELTKIRELVRKQPGIQSPP